MAEKMRCRICGYTTTRSGITNHIKHRHPAEYESDNDAQHGLIDTLAASLGYETKEERAQRLQKSRMARRS